MASKFLDLIKRFSSASQPSSSVPLSPRRPRRVNPQDVRPDITTGHGDSRPRFALGQPDKATKLREEGDWLASDPTHGPGGSVIPKTNRLKAALLSMLQGAGANANRALEQGNVGFGGLAQALGGAGGGAIAGAVDPGIFQRQRHERAVPPPEIAATQPLRTQTNPRLSIAHERLDKLRDNHYSDGEGE